MFCRFTIGLSFTAIVAAAMLAQSPATIGAIRCDSCGLTRQKPEPFDPAKVDTVVRVEPVFMPGGPTGSATSQVTLRMLFIARVLGTSPLRLEMLDSRPQFVDRNMTVVEDDPSGGRDPGTCGIDLGGRPMAVAADAKSLLPTLRFNDLVTGAWMLQRDDASQHNLLGGRPVIGDLRKVTGPPTWFHSVPATPNCQNRSGRLIMYVDPSGGLLSVYNDGGIQYSTGRVDVFSQERMSRDELQELLASFGDAFIDTVSADPDKAVNFSGSRLLLAAARYQLVFPDVPPPALAPLISRLNLLKARAMSNAPLILRTGASRAIQPGEAADAKDIMTSLRTMESENIRSIIRPDGTPGSERMDINKIPELALLFGAKKYLWPRDLGVRLNDVPAGGLTLAWSEVEQHKPVYYGLLNSGAVTVIDGDRLYEAVHICQVNPDKTDRCAPR